MKKIIPFFIIGMLVLSGLGAAVISTADETNDGTEINTHFEKANIAVSQPIFSTQDEFTTIDLEQSETYMSRSGEPMLPVISKTFSFPIGTQIHDVNIDMDWEQYTLEKKVSPVPVILPTSVEIDPAEIEEQKINENVYASTELYPAKQYTIKYGAGLKDMEHVIFVNVKCYTQYSPANNQVNIPTNIDINVEYEPKDTADMPTQQSQYDLIIITHELFEDEFQRLVTHKEEKGISTKLVTVDEIYAGYDGAGDWEEIKMYLADRVLQWDTKFVLLAGGHKGQTHEWYVPDFRSHNWDPATAYDPPYDETYSADLYYADVYTSDSMGNVFMDTWDSNENDIYAEGPKLPSGTDNMDFYPDVHVGRLPLRYEWEADVAIDKIINYENNADDSWFKKAVLAGGDGFPPERYGSQVTPGVYEGEIVCDVFADLLANRGVESTKAYCSDEGDIQVTRAKHVYDEINKGAGFVHLTGHASPFILGSYTPNKEPLVIVPFYNGFNAHQFENEGKLPFMINEGCHNAQFDVTGQDIIDFAFNENPDFVFTRWEFIPHDVSSYFVLKEDGGSIATIGNTGLGLGGIDYGCTEFVGGWIMLRFAEAWAVDGKEYTGSVWTTGINGYIDNFDVQFDDGDRKTIEERALLGDPSVKLGGYGTGSLSETEEETEEYGPVSSQAPAWSVGDSWTYALDNIDIDLSLTDERGIKLNLQSGDIVLEVTDVTSDTYVASLTTNDIDVTFGGMFDFHVESMDAVEIPTASFDNIKIEGELILNRDTLGIEEADVNFIVDLGENLVNIADLLNMQLPGFVNLLTPIMSIPANININVAFEESLDFLQFPLENGDRWGISQNVVEVSIDGSVQSVWLRILSIVNNFVSIIPQDFAQYLPNVDISEVLNDFGIATEYEIALPEIQQIEETPLFEVWGSANVETQAGSFNAAQVSLLENNGVFYYSESEGNFVKMVGQISDYIPIIDDINIELKE